MPNMTLFCQNKDKSGLDSLPETQQWDRTVGNMRGGFMNEDPGVNSDEDDDDMFQARSLLTH